MKMKLLFWMNVFMVHFGIAYYLKEKINADFTAIIDTPNKPKQMFLNQKIVNFKKTWYFHDHIKKIDATPDLEYLSNFEKKYNIDLWKLAINERHFYKFNKFYKFSTNEILKFLEQECKLFEQILEEAKPEKFEIELTAAILAYEIARSDGDISKSELDLLLNEVKKITSKVNKSQDEILEIIETYSKNSVSFHEFIEDINKDYSKEEKLSLIKYLWDVAYADNILEVSEERLIRRIADLIRIKDVEVLKLKDSSKNHRTNNL